MYKKTLPTPHLLSSSDFFSPVIEKIENLSMRIRPEDQILFTCSRQNFLEAHRQNMLDICSNYDIDWEVVYSMAKLHGVAPLVYVNLCQCRDLSIPPKVLVSFKLCLMRNMMAKERLTKNISRAISFFAEKSIDVMLIKGAALDILVYDQPYYIVMADADLVISARREEVSDKQFKEFMAYFHNRGLEYDYFTHHDVSMNGVLPVDFQQIWHNAVKIKFGEQDVFVMAPEDMLLALCINSCRKRFFRLKALCDIAETINKYPDLNWAELIQRARAYDCHNIVYTALLVTTMTVGCVLPDGVLDAFAVNSLRTKIIHYLCRRMSLSSFASLHSDKLLFDRNLDGSLLLSYAIFTWNQVWRRIVFAVFFTKEGMRRTEV